MSYKIVDFLSLLLTSWVTTGLFSANNLHRKMDSEHACMFLFVCFERFIFYFFIAKMPFLCSATHKLW